MVFWLSSMALFCLFLSRFANSFLLSKRPTRCRPGTTTLQKSFGIMTTFEASSKVDLPSSSVVDVYPHDTPLESLDGKYRQIKQLHWIRHAQGTHNVNMDLQLIENIDARLTDLGKEQCRSLADTIQKGERPYLYEAELVVTSPLTRCIQTTLLSLEPVLQKNSNLPVVANELVRETVNYNCDRRRTVAEISKDHPVVDFSHIETDHDHIWQQYEDRLGDYHTHGAHRESAELHVVADRARRFFDWLSERPETHVVVCSHAAFLRCLWNFGHPSHAPWQPPQDLDGRPDAKNEPVVRFQMEEHLVQQLQSEFSNCEMRSMIVAFA